MGRACDCGRIFVPFPARQGAEVPTGGKEVWAPVAETYGVTRNDAEVTARESMKKWIVER
jgi:hypothetical protein